MAKLTTKKRKSLASSSFALPGRRYPIEDPNHARNALARVSQFGTPEEKSKVRSAVHRRYPGIGKPDRQPPYGRGYSKDMSMDQRAGMREGMVPCAMCGAKHQGGEHKGAMPGNKMGMMEK